MTKKNISAVKKFLPLLYLIIILILTLFLFFNDSGYTKYHSLKTKNFELNEEIKSADKKIKQLEAEIDSLRYDLIKIEKVAREKYMMLKQSEKALKIEKK